MELQDNSFSGEMVMGENPRKVRGIGENIKHTLVLGVDAREQGVS